MILLLWETPLLFFEVTRFHRRNHLGRKAMRRYSRSVTLFRDSQKSLFRIKGWRRRAQEIWDKRADESGFVLMAEPMRRQGVSAGLKMG
jgi:hypothetical protein